MAMANVMLDVEALEEAVIFARAAVEIRPHEVSEQCINTYVRFMTSSIQRNCI